MHEAVRVCSKTNLREAISDSEDEPPIKRHETQVSAFLNEKADAFLHVVNLLRAMAKQTTEKYMPIEDNQCL